MVRGLILFNAVVAEQHLVGNFDLLREACEKLDPNFELLKAGAEHADVLIRCYLLPDSVEEVVNEMLK